MRIVVASDPSNLPKLVGAAKSLSPEVIEAISTERVSVPVDKLVIADLRLNDCWTDVLSEREFDLMLLPSTRDFKEVGARVAARKGISYLSDAQELGLSGRLAVTRMVFSGRGVEKLETSLPAVVTIDADSFEPVSGEPSSVDELGVSCSPKVNLIERKERKAEVDLSKAEIIVSVGRGLKKKEDLEMIRELASLLGAEVACTRPISADFKWLPEERHVGMTGVRVKPKIYLALGISGQIQHVVGFRDAETVIAVNTDPDAPISEVSDYFVVADLYEVVPKLIEEIRRRKGS